MATMYMEYTIYSTDAAQIATWQASYPSGFYHCPSVAASLLGTPYATGPLGTKGITFNPPFSPGLHFWFPNDSGIAIDDTQESQTVPGQTDPFGATYPNGLFVWVGVFVLLGGGVAAGAAKVPRRRGIVGFEIPGQTGNTGELPSSGTNAISRDASRTPEGFGYAFRGSTVNDYQSNLPSVSLDNQGTNKQTWERLYVRPRVYPGADTQFWRCQSGSTGAGGEGALLALGSAGQLRGYTVNNASTTTLIGTGPTLTLNVWAKLDVLVKYTPHSPPPGTDVQLQVYVNGVLGLTISGVVNAANSGVRHGQSFLGNTLVSGGANTLELDVDDWVLADWPGVFDAGSALVILDPTGPDWLAGSHIAFSGASGLDASSSGWVGDYRIARQNPAARATATFTSSTALARLAVSIDAVANAFGQQGAVALAAALQASLDGGTLGWNITAAHAETLAAYVRSDSFASNLYRPSGIVGAPAPQATLPQDLTPIVAIATHPNNANAETIKHLGVAVEYVGAWGQEDAPTVSVSPMPAFLGVHNAPYVQSLWSRAVISPMGAVTVIAGTYTGNGTGQDITLPQPAHWWWVRPVGGENGGVHWWTSLYGAHRGLAGGQTEPSHLVQALIDGTGAGVLRVTGNDSQSNQNTITYQYIAVCDPAMRYVLNGAFAHASTVASSVNTLIDSGFTPTACFFFAERFTAVSATSQLWYKGPGHASDEASLLDAAKTTGVATLAAGSITSKTPLHVSTFPQTAFSAWRESDGSGATGVVVRLTSYVGDGTGARTISVNLGGRRPLFALVTPMNAQAWCRDPSHTGSNSHNAGLSSTLTTAITGGGIDQLLVGSTLNANGVTYSVFVLPGGTTACNSGWSCGGTFIPVPPAPPVSTIWLTPNPPVNSACSASLGTGSDSGGSAGCGAALSTGSDSGGSAGCQPIL